MKEMIWVVNGISDVFHIIIRILPGDALVSYVLIYLYYV